MKLRLTLIAVCIVGALALAGCKSSGGGGTGYSATGGGDTGGGDTGGGTTLVHTPEPATIALLGAGLFAYGMIRRKKRK